MPAIVYGTKQQRLLVLPVISIAYFLISVLIILSMAIIVDKVLLPGLEDDRRVVAQGWTDDNNRIIRFMFDRNQANFDNPIWRSAIFPVKEAHPGKKRILVMGDSFVWGDGSSNMNDIWWRQLQGELHRRGYNDVEVIAAGLCGASTHVELDWAKNLVAKYKPDMIVWGYVSNDPEEGSNNSGHGIVKQITLPPDSTFDKLWSSSGRFFPNFTVQLSSLRNRNLSAKLSGPKYGYDYIDWRNKILEEPNFAVYKETVANLAKFLHSLDIPCTFITLCMPSESAEHFAPAEKLFKKNGIEFHNLLDPMISWNARLMERGLLKGVLALGVNPANGHPNVTATHFYAIQSANILEKSYKKVLGEKSNSNGEKSILVNDFVPPTLGVSNPKPNIFGMYYPTKEADFLTMPVRRPFVQLNLSAPVALKEIHVVGKNLQSSAVAVRAQDTSMSDIVVAVHDLGSKKGGGCTFKLPAEHWNSAVDEILVTAHIDGPDRLLLVELVPQ